MKETEKLDIILRGLYELRSTDLYVSPSYFLPDLTREDEIRLGNWLRENNYVKMMMTQDLFELHIITEGVMYCEGDSMSHPGSPITLITYVQTINSPGSTIQVGIQGQVLYPNITEIQSQIDGIRKEIEGLYGINTNMVSEIGHCLDEIAVKVEDRKPVPGFIWDWLGRIDTITSLADKIASLHSLIKS